jgi:hypothetical protein
MLLRVTPREVVLAPRATIEGCKGKRLRAGSRATPPYEQYSQPYAWHEKPPRAPTRWYMRPG